MKRKASAPTKSPERFRQRAPVFVHAWHYRNTSDFSGRPAWLANAIKGGGVTFSEHLILIHRQGYTLSATVGDWIVRHQDGTIEPVPDYKFADLYEPDE